MQKHKILSFLLALAVSIGLWVYAVTVVNPDDTVSIPDIRVRLVGTSDLAGRNLMITGGENQTVDVEIAGRRSDLKQLNSTSLEAVANVGNIETPGWYEISWTLDPPSTVASGDISLAGSNSNKIRVKISEVKERPAIPVEVEYTGTLEDGYVRDPALLSTETISVRGPAEEVEKIFKAVVSVDLEGAKESISQDLEYTLYDENDEVLEMSEYVTVSDDIVHVSVPVSCYKQIPLKVKIVDGGGATAQDVTCTIEPGTIGVSGSEEVLAKLTELVIKEIDLSQISEATTWKVTPDLPAGVTNRATDTTVVISLSFSGLTTRRFTVKCSDIERLDKLENLEFGEQNVVILVRGKSDVVNSLREEDLIVTADMVEDYDSTTKLVTLKITLPNGSKAGVVGAPYTVQVIDTES